MRLPRFLNRYVAIIFAISFFVNLGFSCMSPTFPYYVLALKGVLKEIPELVGSVEAYKASVELGALMAAFMISRAPMAAFVGHLSDLVGRKRIIVLGLTLYFLTAIGFTVSPNIPFLIFVRVLQGVASAMVWPVAEALLTEIVGKFERGKAMSIYVSLMNFAGIFGPSIGVGVYKLYVSSVSNPDLFLALRTPFIFLAAISLMALISSLFLPKSRKTLNPNSGNKPRISRSGIKDALNKLTEEAKRSIYVIYLNGAINGFGMGIVNTSAIVYIIQEVAKDPAGLGLLYSISGIATIASSIFAGHLSDKLKNRKTLILASYILSRPVFFFIPFVKDLWTLIFLYSFATLSFGMGMPLMRVLQADLTPSEVRGTIFGFQQTFFNSGVAAGALIGGYLCAVVTTMNLNFFGTMINGIVIPFWITALLGISTVIPFWIYVSEPKERY
ncbi:hypothetical protein DRO41_04805 [Candidatus Bathyarchaeota archaeon]|nr:MAG: hypothetical protein DRO41_04805 [Candidatus Bathyarchaeota archaeon]